MLQKSKCSPGVHVLVIRTNVSHWLSLAVVPKTTISLWSSVVSLAKSTNFLWLTFVVARICIWDNQRRRLERAFGLVESFYHWSNLRGSERRETRANGECERERVKGGKGKRVGKKGRG